MQLKHKVGWIYQQTKKVNNVLNLSSESNQVTSVGPYCSKNLAQKTLIPYCGNFAQVAWV